MYIRSQDSKKVKKNAREAKRRKDIIDRKKKKKLNAIAELTCTVTPSCNYSCVCLLTIHKSKYCLFNIIYIFYVFNY